MILEFCKVTSMSTCRLLKQSFKRVGEPEVSGNEENLKIKCPRETFSAQELPELKSLI